MSTEKLLVVLLNHLSEGLKDRLILKGGMLLRLLDSPRYTQDLDFVFLSKESKKLLVKEILAVLKQIPSLEITRQDLNSRGIFLDVLDQESQIKTTIEVSVEKSTHLPAEPISTAKISSLYSLSGRILRIMAPAEAFANKIAASLERAVGRDLYDLSLFEPLTSFDLPTLKDRLARLEINRAKAKAITMTEAADLLKKRLDEFSEKKLREEVYPLVPVENHPGLMLTIRASVSRIIQRLQTL